MILSIDEYNIREIKGKEKLSNRFVRAFKPKLFESGGFPTTVTSEQELVRYIDSMHAYSFENYYNNLCNGITKEEFELLKKTTEDIYNLTKERYNSSFLVQAPMIAAICERRLINASIGTDKDKRIFEIGAGASTLGCVLLEEGRKYLSTDVTQAFYLIQNRLYNYITNNKVNELVNQEYVSNSECVHVPYWKLWETKDNPMGCDLVVSNHALLEMSPNSLRFYLNYFTNSLNCSNGAFVFQGGGWRINQNLIDLINLFEQHGYNLQYFDHKNEIAAFSVSSDENCKNKVVTALSKLMKNPELEDIYGLGKNIVSRLENNEIYYAGELGYKIKKTFNIIDKKDKVDIKSVIDYYSQYDDMILSPDEEFANYIEPQSKILKMQQKKDYIKNNKFY